MGKLLFDKIENNQGVWDICDVRGQKVGKLYADVMQVMGQSKRNAVVEDIEDVEELEEKGMRILVVRSMAAKLFAQIVKKCVLEIEIGEKKVRST